MTNEGFNPNDWSEFNPDEWSEYTPPSQGWSGIGQDIYGSGKEFAAEFARALSDPTLPQRIGPKIAEEVGGAAKMPFTDPVRAAQNLGQGAVNFGESVNNLYPNARNYLREKGITEQTSPDLWNKQEHIDIGELTGRGPKKPGDELLSAMIEYMLPVKAGTAGRLSGGFIPRTAQMSSALAAHATGKGENPVKAALALPATELGLKTALGAGQAIKGGIEGATKGVSYAKRAINPDLIAKKIMEDKALQTEKYSGLYNNLFEEAKAAGVPERTVIGGTGIKSNLLYKADTKGFTDALKEMEANPTLENTHKAASKVKAYRRYLKKKDENGTITPRQEIALKETKPAINKLNKAIRNAFNSSNDATLSQRYRDITKGYKHDVVPYETNRYITKFENKELSSKHLIEALNRSGSDKFTLAKGGLYPELQSHGKFKNALKYGTRGLAHGAGLGAGYELFNLIKK